MAFAHILLENDSSTRLTRQRIFRDFVNMKIIVVTIEYTMQSDTIVYVFHVVFYTLVYDALQIRNIKHV